MLIELDSLVVAVALGYLCGAGAVSVQMLMTWMIRTMTRQDALAAWQRDLLLLACTILNLGALLLTMSMLARHYIGMEGARPELIWGFLGASMLGLAQVLAVAAYISRHHVVWAAAMERDRSR